MQITFSNPGPVVFTKSKFNANASAYHGGTKKFLPGTAALLARIRQGVGSSLSSILEVGVSRARKNERVGGESHESKGE